MKHTLSLFILLSTGFLLNSSTPKEMQGSEIVVVLNPNNPVTSMTAGEVKLMWLRKIKKRWPQLKKNIKPVDRSHSCTERDQFYNKILDMSADEVETYFIQKQYQNAEKPPEKFSSGFAVTTLPKPVCSRFSSRNAPCPSRGKSFAEDRLR